LGQSNSTYLELWASDLQILLERDGVYNSSALDLLNRNGLLDLESVLSLGDLI